MTLTVVTRGEWGASPPTMIKPLPHPVPFICLSYNNQCSTHNCELIREIQKSHMKEIGMYDIQSNFLVTSDGTVYEGRGWYAQPAKMFDDYAKYNGKFIDITILGQFEGKPSPGDPAVETLRKLIIFGAERNLLSREYEIVEQGEQPM